ncbi:follistatin-related protein 5-like [Rhopilema esculentum]|uniref:follistatin-related protein 5-like n=1 Tax=Rhopilema esculentum TaxID=499914 RepID=UPI0031DB3809
MYAVALFAVLLVASAESSGVFYALTDNGIDIINAKNLNVVKRLPHDMAVPGTDKPLCTRSPRYKSACGWGGAAVVPGRFVFVADSYGNRVIVLDAKEAKPVSSIQTNGFPYMLKYITALDEVWIHCWKNSYLDVVGSREGATAIQTIKNASSLIVSHSIKAQVADSYKDVMHGYFEAENCQNINRNIQYGVVTHFNEPGIHKIDLAKKMYAKFINTSMYGCKSTFGLAYSSVKNYAFVQCLGILRGHRQRMMVVVDLTRDAVIHAADAITDKATGSPFASPDGKYVLVLNKRQIITYYMEKDTRKIKRLRSIPLPKFMPSRVAFLKTADGYHAYVTSKMFQKLLVITYKRGSIDKINTIGGVGQFAKISEERIQKNRAIYMKYYKLMLAKSQQPFSEEKFQRYVERMFFEHVRRPISVGCNLKSRYIGTPATVANKIAIIDGKKMELVGLVTGVKGPRQLVWVD